MVGKYCDSNPLYLPIETSGQNIWIKFSTDETIQQEGFRFSFEFKKSSKNYDGKNGIWGTFRNVWFVDFYLYEWLLRNVVNGNYPV